MACYACDLADEEEDRIGQARREHIAWYKAFCDKQSDGWLEILAKAPQLAPFQPHPRDKAALVSEFFPKRKPGTNIFDVQVTYSTDVDFNANPLGHPAQITIDSTLGRRPTLFDVDGNPLMNTAFEFLENVESDVTTQIFKVEKNIPIKLESWVDEYGDGVINSDQVTLRGLKKKPGTLKLAAMSIGAEQNIEPQTNQAIKKVPFCVAAFEIHWSRDGWTLITPNVGLMELVPVFTPGKPASVKSTGSGDFQGKRIVERAVQPSFNYVRNRITTGDPPDYPNSPVPLDANGRAIVNPGPNDVILLEYRLALTKPFSALPLK